jgi:hypothetical protein
MPTYQELQSLVEAGSEWTTINGVNGRVFGSDDNTLFLPAAGSRASEDGELRGTGLYGDYWSGTVTGPAARRLYFDSDDEDTSIGYYRSNGFSCRCVSE